MAALGYTVTYSNMATLIDDPKALPKWRFVFVCKSERCLDERLTELKELENKFPQYSYNYKWETLAKITSFV